MRQRRNPASAEARPSLAARTHRLGDQAGLSLIELLVVIVLMAALAGSMSTLVGVAVRSKLIVAVRSADTETARQTLEWMSERLRNAGLNLKPADQSADRCKDMVVALDPALRPTANSIYVSGEILNSDGAAGNEVMTLGYRLGNDPVTGTTVVIEARQPCASGTAVIETPLSDPRITVTNLAFQYFSVAGAQITALTDVTQIRRIRLMRISLTVQGSQGRSGVQTQLWTRDVMLRNPEPNANDWKNLNEDF